MEKWEKGLACKSFQPVEKPAPAIKPEQVFCLETVSVNFNNVSVNSSNAVDKREQPPRKDGCS